MSTPLQRTEDRIERIKRELLALGPMRPGSITRQYRLPKERERPFYQISYTHRMRSRSEYVRPDNLATLRKETATFRRFRKLIDQWVGLALAASQLRVRNAQKKTRTNH
jgi:hypothetical protein